MLTPKHNPNIKNNIVNKGFSIIDNLFKENNWNIVVNEPNWVAYTKPGHETEYFELKIEKSKVSVSIPLKKIPFQYVTSFTDYFQASEYVEMRFKEFISLEPSLVVSPSSSNENIQAISLDDSI
jgi:hypothetical protein